MKQRAVIIGAGLGGLVCGDILARNGYDVCVLEQAHKIGGCIQSFRRGQTVFDTGMHYVGGLEEGQALYPFFRYLNLLDLPWKKLDEDCADMILVGEECFCLPQGYERFVEVLSERFPNEKEGIRTYVELLRKIGKSPAEAFRESYSNMQYFEQNAYEWLQSVISDPLLIKVLSGSYLRLALDKEHLPLFSYAEIQNSYIQSAYRLSGGGDLIAARLAEDIVRNGGQICSGSPVSEIIVENGCAKGVIVAGKQPIMGDCVIAAIHPKLVMQLIPQSAALRPVYRKRMSQLENTAGVYTANICLNEGQLDYCNRMIYVHDEADDQWAASSEEVHHLMIHFYPDGNALDLLTIMPWKTVSQWADAEPGKRGCGYEQLKEKTLEQCLRLAERALPGLSASIANVYCSTPLTYSSYLHSPEGSAFGVKKDCQSVLTTLLSPHTPVGNLLLTGQNLHLHGVMGTTIAAFSTAAELLGREYVYKLLTEK